MNIIQNTRKASPAGEEMDAARYSSAQREYRSRYHEDLIR